MDDNDYVIVVDGYGAIRFCGYVLGAVNEYW